MAYMAAAMAASEFAEGYAKYEYQRGQARIAEAQADFKAVQFEINARILDKLSEEAVNQGDQDARDYMKRIKKFKGSQRAVLAAQGVAVDSGTAADIQQEAVDIGMDDVQTIRNNAFRQAFGYTQEGINARLNARIARISGKYQSDALKFAARTSLATSGIRGAKMLSGNLRSTSGSSRAVGSRPTLTPTHVDYRTVQKGRYA